MNKLKVQTKSALSVQLAPHHEFLEELAKLTNNFKDIRKCKSFDGWELLLEKALKPKKIKKSKYPYEQLRGFVFQPTILMWLLYKFGATYEIYNVRWATDTEDQEESTDIFFDIRNTPARGNMKGYKPHVTVTRKHIGPNYYEQLGKDREQCLNKNPKAKKYTPILIHTSNEVDQKLIEGFRELGAIPGVEHLGRTTWKKLIGKDNNSFFQDFADELERNLAHFREAKANAEERMKEYREYRQKNRDATDQKDIQIMIETPYGCFIATPGWGKTGIQEEVIDHWFAEDPTIPTVYATRVRPLLDQNMRDIVSYLPPDVERILAGGFTEHKMDHKLPYAVGSVNKIKDDIMKCIKSHKTLIGVVSHGEAYTLKELLKLFIKNKQKFRFVKDEALTLFDNDDKQFDNEEKQQEFDDRYQTIKLLEKAMKMGLIVNMHLYDAIFVKGELSMTNSNLNLPSEPLVKHKYQEGLKSNRIVPVQFVRHTFKRDQIDYMMKKYPGYDESTCLEIALAVSVLKHSVADVTKAIHFAHGSESARAIVEHLNTDPKHQLDLCMEILAGTKHTSRAAFKKAMKDVLKSVYGVNIMITAKGLNIEGCSDVVISPKLLKELKDLIHIVGRGVRRLPGERGLSLDQCKKQKSQIHLGMIEETDGSLSASARATEEMKNKFESLTGILTLWKEVKNVKSRSNQTNIEVPRAQDPLMGTADDDLVESIVVEEEPLSITNHKKNEYEVSMDLDTIIEHFKQNIKEKNDVQ